MPSTGGTFKGGLVEDEHGVLRLVEGLTSKNDPNYHERRRHLETVTGRLKEARNREKSHESSHNDEHSNGPTSRRLARDRGWRATTQAPVSRARAGKAVRRNREHAGDVRGEGLALTMASVPAQSGREELPRSCRC